MIMRKVFVILVLAFIFFSCDNDDMNKETNPYPDGVYPFEVSGVGHAVEGWNNFTVTWTPPADKGFTGVQAELFLITSSSPETRNEFLIYSSVTDENNRIGMYKDFIVAKSSFSFFTYFWGDDHFVIIKCVDKFGNISEGVRHELPRVVP
jgi:hypothetical protein